MQFAPQNVMTVNQASVNFEEVILLEMKDEKFKVRS